MSTITFYKKCQCRFCGKMNNHTFVFSDVEDLVYDYGHLTFSEGEQVQDTNFPAEPHARYGVRENNCFDNNCQELEKKYSRYNKNIAGFFKDRKFIGLVHQARILRK